jgi:hypothetical protein
VWNSTANSADELKHKIEVLTRHCDTVGRDPAEIRKTACRFVDPFQDIDGFCRTLESYAALGIDLVMTGPLPGDPDPAGFVSRLGEALMPRITQIG